MKAQSIFIALFLLIGSFSAEAQDLMDALKQTAEAHNEARGEKNGEGELTPEEKERQERFNAWWKSKMENNVDLLDDFPTPEQRCVVMMGLYLYHLRELDREIERTLECEVQYDLLGMRAIMLAGVNAIIYCPEKLANSNVKDEIGKKANFDPFNEVYDKIRYCPGRICSSESTDIKWTKWAEKHPEFSLKLFKGLGMPEWYFVHYYEDNSGWEMILTFFHPESIMREILVTGQLMEQLGCGG